MSAFTWIPFYKELAVKVLEYRDRQGELIALLKELKNASIPVISLHDKTAKNRTVPLSMIDPFTFFAAFNRKATDQNRQAVLSKIKGRLQVQAAVPTDFDGIPIMHPMMSRFLPWQYEQQADDLASLWAFAEAVVARTPEEIPPELFNRCLAIRCVSVTNLTMGMFWMCPDTYLALDSRNRALLDERGVAHEVKDWFSYRQFLKEAKMLVPEPPYEFSRAAYANKSDVNYWVFQGHPKYYDVVAALRDGALKTWEVNQHKTEIHAGDKVIIWVAGESAGCYALATVASEVHANKESPQEAVYRKQPIKRATMDGVALSIDTPLWEHPVTREDIAGHPVFSDFPAGRHGTNFVATKAQYGAILELERGRVAMRYWIYAPGDNARLWQECWEKGIMLYGADQLPDLRQFKNREEIERQLIKVGKLKHRPWNESRACWDFTHVLKPGDAVIAKQGRKAYLGYGIVIGEYERDEDRTTYRNVRRVRWIKKGNWPSGDYKIVTKALTDVTKYADYVNDLKRLIGIDDVNASGLFPPLALNTILYGPPGTGKTFALRTDYMARFTDHAAAITKEDFAANLVAEMTWWQVITMVMLELKASKVSGILEHPLLKARIRQASNRFPRVAVWAHLQMHTKTDCPHVNYAKRYEPLLFSKDSKSHWSIDETLAADEVPELIETLMRYRDFKPGQGAAVRRYEFTTFHQSYSYEDFVEGIKPVISEEVTESLAYEVKPGIFKTMVQRALADPNHDYALLIDEISRGNVANIFGELITLLEDDKRKGAANELAARLPYSRDEFVVPKNLYIIGAMNTADRSVEALDTALRRRFTFLAISPRPDLIEQPASLRVDLRKLLAVINARIERLLDKDHCIGHSYFMGIAANADPLAELRHVFATKILPLMEEYFYGDPAKIGMVLGGTFVSRKDDATKLAAGDWGLDDFEEKHVYSLRDPLTMKAEDFRAVYE